MTIVYRKRKNKIQMIYISNMSIIDSIDPLI